MCFMLATACSRNKADTDAVDATAKIKLSNIDPQSRPEWSDSVWTFDVDLGYLPGFEGFPVSAIVEPDDLFSGSTPSGTEGRSLRSHACDCPIMHFVSNDFAEYRGGSGSRETPTRSSAGTKISHAPYKRTAHRENTGVLQGAHNTGEILAA